MKTRVFIGSLALLLSLPAVISCSEDDYTAYSPEFSDMTFATLDGKTENFRVGDKIVATAVQSRIGKYLYKASYEWSSSPATAEHKPKKSAIYDNEPVNPTDTIVFTAPATYTLLFKGRYNISSSEFEPHNFTVRIPDGKITYSSPSWMYFDVTIEKKIVVRN